MTIEAQKALTESLTTKSFVHVTEAAMRNDIEMMRVQYEQEYSPMVKRLSNELQAKLMKIAKQQAELVIYESNKDKFERATKRKDHLIKFRELISAGLLNAELMWALMQLDLQRVKKRNSFDYKLNEFRVDSQSCKWRMVCREIHMFAVITLSVTLYIIVIWIYRQS